ncbi:MAG: hypothetical protein ACD_7C00422G0002 [uncultured bacterium]|nr:MAG: hypothetical protein ACD_7C00422G0002 [uncultured bacterium]
MSNPAIQLKFDQKLDQNLAWDFYSHPDYGGCNFWKERALYHHPKLLEIEIVKNPKQFLNRYISEFYDSHFDEIKKCSHKTSTYLDKSQDNFFKTVDKIFNHHPWPKKKFTGLFSIFDFCPRFLNWGGFQIFLYDNRRMKLFTIYHEMLHFIFYDFATKSFPEKFKNLNTEKGKFWDLAEVFNAVIQDTDNFIKLHGKIKNIGYPSHKKLILKGKDLWEKDQDLSRWIITMIKII